MVGGFYFRSKFKRHQCNMYTCYINGSVYYIILHTFDLIKSDIALLIVNTLLILLNFAIVFLV